MRFECSGAVAGPEGSVRELRDPFVDCFPNQYTVLASPGNGDTLEWRTNETSLCLARYVYVLRRVREYDQ